MRHNGKTTRLETQSAAFGVDETARFLGVSSSSVWRALRAGSLKRTRIGGRTLIRRVDAERFLDACAGGGE